MLQPLGNRVLLEAAPKEEKTPSGLVLPESAKEKSYMGQVVAVGSGRTLENGEQITPEVEVGDTVLYEQYGGSEITYEGKDYIVVQATDLIAVVK